MLLPEYPNLSEGADHVAGQLRGDKEYPFSGVTKSGSVWRKVPESDARRVPHTVTSELSNLCVVSQNQFKTLSKQPYSICCKSAQTQIEDETWTIQHQTHIVCVLLTN